MFTRSQAKIQKEQQQKQKQHENMIQAINRINGYLYEITDIPKDVCTRYHYRVNKIDEMYTYMLSDKIKQVLLGPSFTKYPKFITVVSSKTQHLKCQLVSIIKMEKVREHREKQHKLLDKLNEMKCYLENNSTTTTTTTTIEKPQQIPLRRSARLMAKRAQ
jgi:hypothetical protein